VWVAVDSINKLILGIRISFERTILVVERFLNSLVKDYGKHSLFHRWGGTWYSYMLVNSWEDRTSYIYIYIYIFNIHEKSIIKREQSNTSKG
jgi:hypothetical protein